MGQVRVPRKGVTPASSRACSAAGSACGFEVAADGGTVIVRRSPLSAAVVRIGNAPGATVFRVRGAGVPLVSLGHVAGGRRRVAQVTGVSRGV